MWVEQGELREQRRERRGEKQDQSMRDSRTRVRFHPGYLQEPLEQGVT